ncbi:MAG: NADP-dependent isocitrate dehydrogenase, partial [Actinomycetota bacterium]
MSRIIYTYTDEAPALATESLQPVLDAFAGAAGVEVETWDISLAGRILATFSDHLEEHQRVSDALSELGAMVKRPEANIIKLPNISASVPQLKAAIGELRAAGYAVPEYPEAPADDDEAAIKARYDAVKGSAVNPVLREGNSDRRAPSAVKAYARKHPHRMGAWSSDSPAHVATMTDGDFRSSERSVTVDAPTEVRVEHVDANGEVTVLKASIPLEAGEILDAAVLSRQALTDFLAAQIADAKAKGVLFSVHLKATMMKVSDPIIFGHAVRTYYAEVFANHGETLAELGVSPNDGMASLERALEHLDAEQRAAIEADIAAAYEHGPGLAQVDSSRGITNLHVPSDIIIDASMPVVIRDSGTMWNADDEQQPAKCVIPDSSYASLYGETIEFC